MTSKKDEGECKCLSSLEEICENNRAIRRVVNKILDKLHEESEGDDDNDNYDYDPDTIDWKNLYQSDDIYY